MVFFVSRHRGAVEWIARQGYPVDRIVSHLDVESVAPGDVVVGTLPVNVAAQVCARGGRYLHLILEIPEAMRGAEMDADQMERAGARLAEFRVEKVETNQ